MNDGPFNEDPLNERMEDNDPLWRLLGESPRPQPDAWFTVRTLARCRYEGLASEVGGVSLARIWRWALGGGLGVSLAVFLLVSQVHPGSPAPDKQKNVQEAFEVMASLDSSDSDSTSSSSPSWQDSSL